MAMAHTKLIKKNLIITLLITLTTVLASKIYPGKINTLYYSAIFFFFIIYLIQAFFLSNFKKTPHQFMRAYNISAFFKMIASVIFLATYYIFFSKDTIAVEKILFTAFFLGLYFIYLITGVVHIFNKK